MQKNHYMKSKGICEVCNHKLNEHYVGYRGTFVVYTCHHEIDSKANGFFSICCGCNLKRIPHY